MPVNTKQVIYKENGQQVHFSPETDVESLVTSSSGTGNILVTDGSGGVTISEKSTSSFYELPSGGIPESDLSSEVQTKLDNGGGDVSDVLRYSPQTLSSAEQSQARTNIGATAPEVFWATYGTTTAAEIDAAVAAGKAIFCFYSGRLYKFDYSNTVVTNGLIQFSTLLDASKYYLYCKHGDNTWLNGSLSLQVTSNKVNSWQSTPDNTHYPSEKLVKDSLDTKIDNTDVESLTAVDVDTAPTQNSTNLITSGGVYAVVGNIESLLAAI